MSIKPRKQLLARSDDRVMIQAALFLACAVLSAAGMGALALWCFLPAALLVEVLGGVAPDGQRRRA